MDPLDLGPIVKTTIGPIVIAATVNAFIYGFNFVQFIQYQIGPGKDSIHNQ